MTHIMFIDVEYLPWPKTGHGRYSRPLREDSSGFSYRLPIVSTIGLLNSGYTSRAFIVSEVLFETLNRDGKVLKKALR